MICRMPVFSIFYGVPAILGAIAKLVADAIARFSLNSWNHTFFHLSRLSAIAGISELSKDAG